MLPAVGADGLDGAAFHQAAARQAVRNHHDAVGIDDLGRLRHEPHAAKCNHVALEFAGLARQLETVADAIGQLLDFRILIVMRQQDGLAVALELQDFVGERGSCGNHGC